MGADSTADDDREDEEIQLQWAAIERLPTFKLLRTSLFETTSNDEFEGKKQVTDVTKLGDIERRLFIEKLINHIENDNLKLLQRLKERIDRVNVELPTVEVRNRNVSVEAECEIVQGKPLPTLWNSLTSAFSAIKSKSGEAKISILKDVSDIIMEVSRKEKEAGIVPDVDTYMKVLINTFSFFVLIICTILETILGLDICADTIVGSALRRGVSGGQKKRLTTGEMIVSPTKALFMDEISTGLDSSTTFQIVTYLQQLVYITDATALVSLLQPAPETFNLFDDVILMAEGMIVYHGPCSYVLQYFEDCGFKCPQRKGVADFLQEITSKKDQAQYWCCIDRPYSYVSVDQFSRKFKASHLASTSCYRFIASIFQTMVVASTAGSMTLLLMFLFGGFILPRYSLLAWLRWGFWISPMTYGEIGLSINEFLGNTTIGRSILTSRNLDFDGYFYWISIGALLGFKLFFDLGSVKALAYFNLRMSRAIISKKRFSQLQGREDSGNNSKLDNENESALAVFPKSRPGTRKIALPFEPLTITFKDVQYYVDTPPGIEMRKHGFNQKKLQLLNGITGAFRPGILTSLMCVSGAGKTTLMDVLSGRKTGGTIEGEIRIGGYPKRFVAEVIETIELDDTKDSLVGVPGQSGLSTEQRKRLRIAVELVSNPSIIFMDEPTSGLDARAAAIVMRAVKNVVSTGRTTVCTIHQPTIDVFEAFDELILMKTGGQIIYSGMLGQHSSKLIEYFEGISGVLKIKGNSNPATWMLEVTSTSMEAGHGLDFAKIYTESPLYLKTVELVRQLSEPQPGSRVLHFPSQFPQSTRVQFMACLLKQHLSYWRNPAYNLTRLMFMIFAAFLFGTLFWQKGKEINNEQDLFNILGSMYTASILLGIDNGSNAQPYVATERTVLYRENFAGMYSPWAYSFAQLTIEVPYLMVLSIIYVAITYPMIGFYWSVYKVFCKFQSGGFGCTGYGCGGGLDFFCGYF
ncbi:hypothetical protein Ddye_022121 [Dipteronia dyeriana]|uniref:ABC transporter domain-containing protein n=1 Tax=Dipteronia dyeriana TaxID=168575 RepID=A0AAD9U3P2_9ROSI|nr:hypothetical protein Ddye_022121 [Dipteronia dyeriana]